MKRFSLIILIATFQLLLAESVHAEIKLPALVSSNMVLQRNTTVVLWGWADPKESISLDASWLKSPIDLKADNEGNWRVDVKTTNSKEAQTITIKGETSNVLLENILFGEVWLCSGQSNMEQPVKGFFGQPTFGSVNSIPNSHNPNLRLFSVDKVASMTPINNMENYSAWQSASPESVAGFSAIAYYYGQQLQEILDVPVGMIHTSWGGSLIEAWMSRESLSSIKEVDLSDVDLNRGNRFPTVLFNAMINPLIPYTIKGVLWYQGEANLSNPEAYKKLFPVMVKDWRTRWGIGDFPFYYVQIAPFLYGNNNSFQTSNNSAFMREAQLQSLDLIPNSGIAITMDVGSRTSIHPPKKKEVADRLLYNALNQTYGYQTVDYAAPIFESQEVKDNGILLKFKNAESGLYSFNELEGFEIAGEDKMFYPANAKIVSGKDVFVISSQVPNPVAVRYAWRNWVTASLYDTYLLPASSFRTDKWDDATHSEIQ